MNLTRRRFLALLPPFFGGLIAFACGDDAPPSTRESAAGGIEPAATSATGSQQLAPTPACGDDDEPTIAQTEGPYFTPNSPERTSFLEAGVSGTKLVVEGFVLSTNCRPLAGALLDFWHADDAGEYDNVGYKLRGHQFTDSAGRYRLETIMPGLYTGRTRHIHVKVQAPGGPVLTTQLYFPADAAANRQDNIFNASLLMTMSESGGSPVGTFNFVLAV